MTIPTEVDWDEREKGDLDAEYAHKMFAGKSVAEALAMFRDNVLERAEDIRFMPTVPFRYLYSPSRNTSYPIRRSKTRSMPRARRTLS